MSYAYSFQTAIYTRLRGNQFLAEVTSGMFFGSYLHTDATKLGDVDVVVELRPERV
jgi:predicted nucleotidyltransferase